MPVPNTTGRNEPQYHDQSRYWVSIAGVGAGGARIFYEFINQAKVNRFLCDKIGFILLDNRAYADYGRGVAWGQNQSELFLANMRLNTMGLPEDLFELIKAEVGISDDWNAQKVPEQIQFQMRTIIGNYLHRSFQETRLLADELQIPVHVIEERVNNVEPHGRALVISTRGGNSYFTDYVILALGNVPKRSFQHLHKYDDFVVNPWQWDKYGDRISGRRIAVLGLGPTAVDVIIYAAEKGAESIFAASRKGYMQYPRPKNQPFSPKHLSEGRLHAIFQQRTAAGEEFGYESLYTMLENEFVDANACTGYEEAKRHLDKLDHRSMLLQGQQSADTEALWYSVMKSLDSPTPLIWHNLSPEGKQEYRKKLEAYHMCLSFGMAYNQSRRLVSLFDGKKLKTGKLRDGASVNGRSDGSFEVHHEHGVYDADLVINCTGIGSTRDDFHSELVDSLHARRWIKDHPEGGFYVDFESGQVVDTSGRFPAKVYSLVGSFTRGTHLLTNCLSQLFVSCQRTSSAVLQDVIGSCPAYSHKASLDSDWVK